jgi:hypothetical protein
MHPGGPLVMLVAQRDRGIVTQVVPYRLDVVDFGRGIAEPQVPAQDAT